MDSFAAYAYSPIKIFGVLKHTTDNEKFLRQMRQLYVYAANQSNLGKLWYQITIWKRIRLKRNKRLQMKDLKSLTV